jgi:predicted NBD/HSP70 family sugar kinase
VYGLKHQKEKRSMDHFAGLDVSVKETSVCIVDDTGRIVREVKVASEPAALQAVLTNLAYRFKRIDWKLDRCRNGCSVLSPKLVCRRSALRRGT